MKKVRNVSGRALTVPRLGLVVEPDDAVEVADTDAAGLLKQRDVWQEQKQESKPAPKKAAAANKKSEAE